MENEWGVLTKLRICQRLVILLFLAYSQNKALNYFNVSVLYFLCIIFLYINENANKIS